MPSEPSLMWWPIGVIAFLIAAFFIHRYITKRDERDEETAAQLSRDRSKLHDHGGMLNLHEYRLNEHGERLTRVEDDVRHLKDERRP